MTKLTGPFERLSTLALRASLAVEEFMELFRAPARSVQWAAQYPVFRCPYTPTATWSVHGAEGPVPEPCGHTWDRREISTEQLRAEVWDHMAGHVGGEAGLHYASRVVSTIVEGPR